MADGKLFITTKWEPDFKLSKEVKAEYKHSELDVFEFVGKSKRNNLDKDKKFPFATHDWSAGQGDGNVWKDFAQLDWRVADDCHTYGCNWAPDGLKFCADGKLVKRVVVPEEGVERRSTADSGAGGDGGGKDPRQEELGPTKYAPDYRVAGISPQHQPAPISSVTASRGMPV